jgi:hypothetical protein
MVGESAPLYRQALADSMHRYRETGARVAVDEFLQKRWPGYQERLEGAFEQAVADAATSFAVDVPVTLDSRFGDAEARQITQPVLVVLGEKSAALHRASPRPIGCCSGGYRALKASSSPTRRTSCRWRTRTPWPRRSPTSTPATHSAIQRLADTLDRGALIQRVMQLRSIPIFVEAGQASPDRRTSRKRRQAALSARLPRAWSRQLPSTSPEEWHGLVSGVEAVDLDLVAADHEVRVDVGAVDAHAP